MYKSEPAIWALQSVGVIHRVDTINRELAVMVNGDLVTFDVPVVCEIILHSERVRFRMLQPRDLVRITHTGSGRLRVALAIDVQPNDRL